MLGLQIYLNRGRGIPINSYLAVSALLEQVLAEYSGPYNGVPAFDKMDLALLKPALEIGMAKNLEEIAVIADNLEPPTFENTIVPLERAGRDLNRVFTYWGIWSANKSSPEFRSGARKIPLFWWRGEPASQSRRTR